MKLGIIPAAGKGERWGGYHKMMLPCGDGEYLIDRAIRLMPAHQVVVICSSETMPILSNHLGNNPKVIFKRQRYEQDIWGAIKTGLDIEAEYYYFAMPDTYFPEGILDKFHKRFAMGMFYTTAPERFGMWRNRDLVNKEPGPPGWAWGTFGIDASIAKLWREKGLYDYTHALRICVRHTKDIQYERMSYYYDMASWSDYAEFVRLQK